jgi:hypothetical protein
MNQSRATGRVIRAGIDLLSSGLFLRLGFGGSAPSAGLPRRFCLGFRGKHAIPTGSKLLRRSGMYGIARHSHSSCHQQAPTP